MLSQLKNSSQWFIDGTFSIAPIRFQQLIVLLVFLPKFNIFYPATFIVASNKTQRLYTNIFRTLLGIACDEGFKPDPKLLMSDFEKGLQNALCEVFEVSDSPGSPKIIGCYFHYVKCLIKKAKEFGLIPKEGMNKNTKILLCFLKIIVHCPIDQKREYFDQLQELYKGIDPKIEKLLAYFKKKLA